MYCGRGGLGDNAWATPFYIMTVGRHRPVNLPKGSRPATCDICGVEWYSDQLTLKADGQMYCPDDVRGADSVTLAEANARDSARAMRRTVQRLREGSPDTSTDEIRVMPTGALGTNLAGWWGYRNLNLGDGVQTAYNFPFVNQDSPGHLYQPTIDARPAFDGDNDITFDGSDDYLLSGSRAFVAAGALPRVYVVGSFDDPDNATADTIFTLCDFGVTQGYTSTNTNRVYLFAQNGTITASYFAAGSPDELITAGYQSSSTALHLWTVELQADRLVLYEDGVQVASTLSAGAVTSPAMTYLFMGADADGSTREAPTTITSHDGKCNEMVVSKTTVTTAQDTDLKTYFGRNFTELTIT